MPAADGWWAIGSTGSGEAVILTGAGYKPSRGWLMAIYRPVMADITIWHNPNCSTSKFAVQAADEADVDVELRKYMLVAQRPSRDEILDLIKILEDPPTDLVRRDAKFKSYGLSDDDVATADQVADVLAEHGELLQRPILVKGDRAIIGRPKDRVAPFLEG